MLSQRDTGGSRAGPGHHGVAEGWTWQGDRTAPGWAKPSELLKGLHGAAPMETIHGLTDGTQSGVGTLGLPPLFGAAFAPGPWMELAA